MGVLKRKEKWRSNLKEVKNKTIVLTLASIESNQASYLNKCNMYLQYAIIAKVILMNLFYNLE